MDEATLVDRVSAQSGVRSQLATFSWAGSEAAAEARGWTGGIEKGVALAERSLLLELAHELAPERAAELGVLDSIADLKREVMALVERQKQHTQ